MTNYARFPKSPQGATLTLPLLEIITKYSYLVSITSFCDHLMHVETL